LNFEGCQPFETREVSRILRKKGRLQGAKKALQE